MKLSFYSGLQASHSTLAPPLSLLAHPDDCSFPQPPQACRLAFHPLSEGRQGKVLGSQSSCVGGARLQEGAEMPAGRRSVCSLVYVRVLNGLKCCFRMRPLWRY